ncbi:hypothetical protein OJF2_70750 [Aquisphaera giovannonii]|uniref:Glycosyltransferase RgtA/B/C/D-like domain-containing protein n=1 Tax=Aquisphaera giovannonii TaxID=406548 RepID=A0A5B9WD25_9BACT|nr:glycosyltransferase family 39 protein [Aquisphaera giovannonii]QEH38472.1 hypothetical protein OJF2_70750 [Aquisphaera giovannonii]
MTLAPKSTAAAACLIAAVAAAATIGQAALSAPPRFDGAGYAVLARSLGEGSGYRAIDHPDRPRHAHFPPGYPAFLAAVWAVTGTSWRAAHLASCACTVAATLLAWLWFRRLYSRDAAFLLGLALAANWIWTRTGSGIQSEPLFLLLGQAAILAATMRPGDRPTAARAAGLGALIAACLLTRQVAIGLALAVFADLGSRRRWRALGIAAATAAALVGPWVAWSAAVGGRSQAGLLLAGEGASGLARRVASQAWFYLQRIPDQVTGPFVEIATVIRPSPRAAGPAAAWVAIASGAVVLGWIVAARGRRRRLAGLVPLLTMPMLLAWPYTEAGRFLIPLIPPLLVGAVEGLSAARRAGMRRLLGARQFPTTARTRRLAAVTLLALSVPYTGYLVATGRSRALAAGASQFDGLCADLLKKAGNHPGPVLTRHPGEVFLATGRQALEVSTSERPGDADASPEEIDRLIERYGVAYVLVDNDRYLNAATTPLGRYANVRRGTSLREISSARSTRSYAVLYEVRRPAPAARHP